MAKIGCLKPFRGSYSNLANIVLEDGEVAFETSNKSIYMGDGVNTVENLAPFISNSNITIIDVVVIPITTDMPQLTFIKFSNGMKRLKITSFNVVATLVEWSNVVPSGYAPYDNDARGVAITWNDVGTRIVMVTESNITVFASSDNSTGLVCRMNYI